jgi:hypothetical protein
MKSDELRIVAPLSAKAQQSIEQGHSHRPIVPPGSALGRTA